MNQIFLNAHSKKTKYLAENLSYFVSRKGACTISFELQMTNFIQKSSYKVLTKWQKLQPFNGPCNDDRSTKIHQLQKVTSFFLEQKYKYALYGDLNTENPNQRGSKLRKNYKSISCEIFRFLFHQGKFFFLLAFALRMSPLKCKNVL